MRPLGSFPSLDVPTADERSRFARAHKALHTIAVTGTNGKTTTTSMVAAIVAASGETSAHLTTLGSYIGTDVLPLGPPETQFLQTVEAAIAAGVATFALEVTSKALKNGWAQQWPASIAVFTNLSRDHLDMHGSAEAYFAAKAQLFMHVDKGAHCVLNAADENSALLAETIPKHATTHQYNAQGEDANCALSATSVASTRTGLEIRLAASTLADALGGVLYLSIVGDVHASNALAAALAAHCAGFPPNAIKAGLARFWRNPGSLRSCRHRASYDYRLRTHARWTTRNSYDSEKLGSRVWTLTTRVWVWWRTRRRQAPNHGRGSSRSRRCGRCDE